MHKSNIYIIHLANAVYHKGTIWLKEFDASLKHFKLFHLISHTCCDKFVAVRGPAGKGVVFTTTMIA